MPQDASQVLYRDDLDFEITPYWRESTIDKIKRAALANPCTYVWGKSGVGKSWMLKRVTRDLLKDGHFVVYYQLPRIRITNIGQVIEGLVHEFAITIENAEKKKLDKGKALKLLKIWSSFFLEWGANLAQAPDPMSRVDASLEVINASKLARFNYAQYEKNSVETFNDHLSDFVKCLKDDSKYLIVILDQIERVNKEKLSYLNDIVEKRPKRIQYIFSSYYKREEFFEHAVAKHFYPKPITITDFTNDEIRELIRINGLLDREEAKLILNYASGSTERAGYCVCLQKRLGKFTCEDVKFIEEQSCKEQLARVRKAASGKRLDSLLKAFWCVAVVGERDCPSVGHLREYLKLQDASLRLDVLDNPTFCDLLVKRETGFDQAKRLCFGYRDEFLRQCFKKDAERYSQWAPGMQRSTDEITQIHDAAASYYWKDLKERDERSINDLAHAMSEASFHAKEAKSGIFTENLDLFVEFELNIGDIEEAKADIKAAEPMFAQQANVVNTINTLVRVSDVCSRQDRLDMVNQISQSIAELAQPVTSDAQPKAITKHFPETRNYSSEEVEDLSTQLYLGGVKYPTDKRDLVDQARLNRAPAEIVSALNKLMPDSPYDSPADVSKTLSGSRLTHDGFR